MSCTQEDRLHSPDNRKISPEKFRLICRAYETLSDREKFKRYREQNEWIADIPLSRYTLQQLAAEPDLAPQLKIRLQNTKLRHVNAQDPSTGHTPLYCAARACNIDAVYYLTEQGAEPDLAQRTGSTALHVSAFYGHLEIVRCLLESGADYRKTNSFGNVAEKEALNDEVRHTFKEMKKESICSSSCQSTRLVQRESRSHWTSYRSTISSTTTNFTSLCL